MKNFTKLFLSNIINHDERDVQWQISIWGSHLSTFWNYFMNREGSFKIELVTDNYLDFSSISCTICLPM